MEKKSSLTRDYGITIVLAILAALSIRYFILEAYRIPSPYMRPTLEAGDTIFVAKWPFGLHLPWVDHAFSSGRMPARGEVVVFTDLDQSGRDYIKRVIGLPGETVEMKSGKISIDGKPLALEPISKTCSKETLPGDVVHETCFEPPLIEDFGPQKIPAGSVFLIGDLRSKSPPELIEHKTWGIIPLATLRGSALWIWLSTEPGKSTGLFPQFRFDRMLKRIR